MNNRPTVITDIPAEVLQVIFSISIGNDYSAACMLRLVSHSFFDIVERSTKGLVLDYLGPYQAQALRYSSSHSYVSLFGKILKTEATHLKLSRHSNGVSLNNIAVSATANKLPEELDFFIISIVNSRSFNEVFVLLEEIRLSYSECISYSRVKEFVWLQALMNYNDMEFIRLSTVAPISLDDEIDDLPLIFHAARFGNCNLVKYLVENDVYFDDDLIEYVEGLLLKHPCHSHWQAIHIYLLERISPQVAPPDWPGPL